MRRRLEGSLEDLVPRVSSGVNVRGEGIRQRHVKLVLKGVRVADKCVQLVLVTQGVAWQDWGEQKRQHNTGERKTTRMYSNYAHKRTQLKTESYKMRY